MSPDTGTDPARLDPRIAEQISGIVRAEHGRVVATLIRRLGDIDLAEDAVAEALVTALERWPVDGLPPNPGAWLTKTAGNKAIDRIRREGKRDAKHNEAVMLIDDTPPEPTGPVEDDRLRLVFTCCHPALALENRVALTLRLLGGLTVAEIAHAFLIPETTMSQRITRSKQKIKSANIPYRVPAAEDLPSRLAGVLAVLYLVFNEGYLTSGAAGTRVDLSTEAIRLTRQLAGLVEDAEVSGLLALMLLTEARHPARVDSSGSLVTLDRQDRSLWDAALIDEGHSLVRRCLALNRPGPYQLQAAINAVHTDALDASMTDWSQIVQLYDQLRAVQPTPVVELNRAVAVAELDGPEVGLSLVDRLPLEGYHAWHVTRAELLRRLGREDEARTAYDAALDLVENAAERAHLLSRRESLRE